MPNWPPSDWNGGRDQIGISGRLRRNPHDAIPADQANQAIGDATHKADLASRGVTPTAKPMTDLVFEARLEPTANAVSINGHDVPLAAGMTVTVEIKTGSRRMIGYLFSPLVEVISGAGRER
jgi:hemolysin D